MSDELGIKFFTLYIESIVNEKTGLKTTDWLRGGESSAFTIKDNDGNYQGQVALAYDQSKSLWIVSSERDQLEFAESYIDLWSGLKKKIFLNMKEELTIL